MFQPKPRSSLFPKRPYLDQRIDRWKLLLLTLCFLLLILGALTWTDGIPWNGIFWSS